MSQNQLAGPSNGSRRGVRRIGSIQEGPADSWARVGPWVAVLVSVPNGIRTGLGDGELEIAERLLAQRTQAGQPAQGQADESDVLGLGRNGQPNGGASPCPADCACADIVSVRLRLPGPGVPNQSHSLNDSSRAPSGRAPSRTRTTRVHRPGQS